MYLKTGTLITLDTSWFLSHAILRNYIFTEYLFHDEEAADPSISPSTINILELIADIQKEAKNGDINPQVAIDSDQSIDHDIRHLPTTIEAISHHTALSLQSYLTLLPISYFPYRSSQDHTLPITDHISNLDFQILHLALQIHQRPQKKPSTLKIWLESEKLACNREGREDREDREDREVGRLGARKVEGSIQYSREYFYVGQEIHLTFCWQMIRSGREELHYMSCPVQ